MAIDGINIVPEPVPELVPEPVPVLPPEPGVPEPPPEALRPGVLNDVFLPAWLGP